MTTMKVESISIEKLLEQLKTSGWLVPSFQRDFVWSEGDVVNLVASIIDCRPIGMATLWEQPDETALDLDSINVPDRSPSGELGFARFSDPSTKPNKVYAILDGRQRCTAIAMAFGGFRPADSRRRFAGRFFLNVAANDPLHRVRYIKETEVRNRQLDVEANCIAEGLFPLASYQDGEPLFEQWMRYLQAIQKPEFYPNAQLPDAAELARRDGVLKAAFSGITKTLLAVYVVPQTYSLGEICEIFETLNTTGTKVSTVDLIHSWLYTDTSREGRQPLSLRDWIDELGQLQGAIGWASRDDRPELIAQIVTASYIALTEKAPPRRVGRKQAAVLTSVKAGDLLATPTEHWEQVIGQTQRVAEFLGDFQKCVARGYFPYSRSPYPVSSAIYVGIRWHMMLDAGFGSRWSLGELDAIYRAFYWRNALMGRYDQGFLTQLGIDLKALMQQLFKRSDYGSTNEWATASSEWLSTFMGPGMPNRETLADWVTDVRPVGGSARIKALTLPMFARVRKDLLEPELDISYPADGAVELHHIYPKQWARDNCHGDLADWLDVSNAGKDYVNSLANLMPLSRDSNLRWKAKLPGRALTDSRVTFDNAAQRLADAFIDRECFDILTSAVPRPGEFWQRRSTLIADHLLSLCQVAVI